MSMTPDPDPPAPPTADAGRPDVEDTTVAAETSDADATAAGSTPVAPAPLDPAAVGALLAAQFPALFGGAPKPIKLHIQTDIQARAPGRFSRRALSAFLHRHTGSTAYLAALSKATQRFDLDGQPAGELSAEHRDAALQELARRRSLRSERIAQDRQRLALEDQQRHNRAHLLRDFERTTLTRANFCALKGVADDALDELLAIARRERDERPPRPTQPPRAPRPRAGGNPGR